MNGSGAVSAGTLPPPRSGRPDGECSMAGKAKVAARKEDAAVPPDAERRMRALAPEWTMLADRFRLAAETPASLDRLYAMVREAGQRLLKSVAGGRLLGTDWRFTVGVMVDVSTEQDQKQTTPSHKRAQRSDVEGLFADPYCRWFNIYVETYLADAVDLPIGGFAGFDNRGRDEGQTRAMMVERAQAYAQCCSLLAERELAPKVPDDETAARLASSAARSIRDFLAFVDALDTDAGGNRVCPEHRLTLEDKWTAVCEACNALRRHLRTGLGVDERGFENIDALQGENRELFDLASQALWKSAITRYTRDGRDVLDAPDPIVEVGRRVVEADRIRKLRAIATMLALRAAPPVPPGAAGEMDRWRANATPAKRERLAALADNFADLAKHDRTLFAKGNSVGEAWRYTLASGDANVEAVRTFHRLAEEASRTLGLAPVGSEGWLARLFAVGEGMGYVEVERGGKAELQSGDTTEPVPFFSRTICNAAEASALLLRKMVAEHDTEEPAGNGGRGGGKGTGRVTEEAKKRREESVRAYIRGQREKGVPVERIARDDIASATGIPASAVSSTGTWKALAAEKKTARSPRRLNADPEDIDAAIAARDWGHVRAAQEREARHGNG